MVLVGGDGAAAALQRVRADAIRLHGTLAPGVPVGTILGGAAHGMRVVTRSGGFGRSDSLLEIVARLQSEPLDPEGPAMTSAPARRPVLAVTLGDVAGIGPEITAKTLLQHPELRERCVPVVVGDADAMRAGVTRAGLDADSVRVIDEPARRATTRGRSS